MMNAYEQFRSEILKRASVGDGDRPVHVKVMVLANEFRLPLAHVREQLVNMEQLGFIRLSAWDGKRELCRASWPDDDSFFANITDSGYVRIGLLSRGAEMLLETERAAIGFAQ